MNKSKICVVGLGNVGLDLALNFSKKYHTIGFDINNELIANIKAQKKKYLKTSKSKKGLEVTYYEQDIADCDVYIITVPTPVNKNKSPRLDNVIGATKEISRFLTKSNIVIYESTFYPGITDDVCIPLIEKESKLKVNKDFFVGYSPERINIGENEKLSKDIIKITSGSNRKASIIIDQLYKTVITAGTYRTDSIKLAECVKILENCQRDVNIALMNEFSKFFNEINIDTKKVVEAASTKWNFAKFLPGLVGGECIAVDPYYIMHAAKAIDFNLPLVSLARETNENMIKYVYEQIIKLLPKKQILNLAFFGISYKENCGQISNSMYLKLAKRLNEIYSVDIYDHLVERSKINLNLSSAKMLHVKKYDAIIIGSKHKKYKNLLFENYLNDPSLIIDIHGISKYSKNVIL